MWIWFWRVIFSLLNGLLSNIILGLEVNVLIRFILVCWLLESVFIVWLVMLLSLMVINNVFMVLCFNCLFLYVLLGIVNVMFLFMVMCLNKSVFWNIIFILWRCVLILFIIMWLILICLVMLKGVWSCLVMVWSKVDLFVLLGFIMVSIFFFVILVFNWSSGLLLW